MAHNTDLDRIALALPGVTQGRYWDDDHAYLMERARGGRGLAQRRSPRRDEGTVDPATGEPYPDLIVVHTATEAARTEALSALPPEVVFTIPHFARSYAVLAHLDRIDVADLEDLIDLAWTTRAPKRLVAERKLGD